MEQKTYLVTALYTFAKRKDRKTKIDVQEQKQTFIYNILLQNIR